MGLANGVDEDDTRAMRHGARDAHLFVRALDDLAPGAAARQWLAEREAELLPVPYYHVVFTLPAAIGAIAFHNKAAVYDLLFRTKAETLITIAADPKHLGARIGLIPARIR